MDTKLKVGGRLDEIVLSTNCRESANRSKIEVRPGEIWIMTD